MEALKLVMPWLEPQELGVLAQTCRAMDGAVRRLTECRVGDVTQGHETLAVPILNDVDDCRYPYFHYTPFCQFSSSSNIPRLWKPWGSASASAESMRRKAVVAESEFAGAMTKGSVLQGVGCSCPNVCTPPGNRKSPDKVEEQTEEGTGVGEFYCSGLKSFHLPRPDCSMVSIRPESGDFQTSPERVQRKRGRLISRMDCCGCGRMVGGQRAYDQFSRLIILTERTMVQSTLRNPDNSRGLPFLSPGETIPGIVGNGSSEVQTSVDLSGNLQAEEQEEGPSSVTECGPACACSSDCKYRVSQRGVVVRLKVVRTKKKGWSLCSNQQIMQGSFVCEYGGELITNSTARERHMDYDNLEKSRDWQGSALLVLREHLPSGRASLRVNVDATRIGNVARFINHSCDGGNLVPCLIRPAGCIIPKLALFAKRCLSVGEELTYSYGTAGEVVKVMKPCFCGTSACTLTLPSEST